MFLLEQFKKRRKNRKFSSQEKTNINQIRKANKGTWKEGKKRRKNVIQTCYFSKLSENDPWTSFFFVFLSVLPIPLDITLMSV